MQEIVKQLGNVKAFRIQLFAAGFQLHQGGHFFDQLGHFLRFVLNYFTIVVPVFRAGGNVFAQAFSIILNQRNRRLELVGNVGDKGTVCFVLLFLLPDIPLQTKICCTQFGNDPFQRFGHGVDAVAQIGQLISSVAVVAITEIQPGNTAGHP